MMKLLKKKRLRLLAGLLAGLFLLAAASIFGVNGYIRGGMAEKLLSPQAAADWGGDCILVLGAGLRPDGSPSLMLGERVDMGVRLWESGAAEKLLMSGDHGQADYDEVNAMKDRAMEAGVPSAAVFMDHAGFSTYESLYRALAVFQVRRVVIVSQEYHLYRALYIAQRLGLEAVGVACDTQAYSGQVLREAREVLARDKDFLYCLFWPKPSYLGPAIPISGSGDQTNDRG